MKSLFLIAILSAFPTIVFAHEAESAMRLEAIRTIYSDPDIVRYVCPDSGNCDIHEFSEKLDINTILLNVKGAKGIQIEPTNKGAQFFSAIFLQEQCKYKMVFPPDITFNGVKILAKQKNNFYVLRATERESAEAWKEYEFSYDATAHQYSDPKTRCFRVSGGRTTSVKCE